MKKITKNLSKFTLKSLLLTALLSSGFSFGQTTVFSDNFNRGNVSPGGTPSVTYTTLSLKNDRTPQAASTASFSQIAFEMPSGGSSGSPLINLADGALNLLQGGTAESGTVQVTAPLSAYSSPFNPILSSNTQGIEWTFNLRTNRGTATGNGLSGFSLDGSGTNYGIAVVLAGSNSNILENGTGYVLTFHQLNSSSSNVISLRKYSDGVYSCSTCPTGGATMSTIISAGTPLANRYNFVSVKVTYNPSNNEWNLYVRDDGDSAWGNPSTLTSTDLVGTVVDDTYTSTAMTTFGYYFKHGTSNPTNNQAFFENFKVVLDPTLSSNKFESVSASLYPNPAKNEITISSKINFNSIEIYNILGQKVKEAFNLNSNLSLTVEISELENATYIVKLNTVEGIVTTKFVKN